MKLTKFSSLIFLLLLSSCNQMNGMKEISGGQINQYFGQNVYSLLPKIYSNDYEVIFAPSEEYPVDVYVDLADWTEEEATNYQEALDKKYTSDANNVYTIGNSLYALIYAGETVASSDFGINIYASSDFIPTAPSAKDEINADDFNTYFDFDLYATLPKIYSEDYEFKDASSVDYPVDIYLELLDWHYPDA